MGRGTQDLPKELEMQTFSQTIATQIHKLAGEIRGMVTIDGRVLVTDQHLADAEDVYRGRATGNAGYLFNILADARFLANHGRYPNA